MARRLLPLTGDLVEQLSPPCRTCLFFERGQRPGTIDEDGALAGKQAWVSAQTQQGRPPGRVLYVDDEVAGWCTFALSDAFSRPVGVVPPASDDALLLGTVRVLRPFQGAGLSRVLLQATLKEALRLDLAAVEAHADRRWRERGCLLPVTWLLHEGFVVHRESPRVPLLRLELRRTARWAESMEAALEELLGHVPRPVGVRAPERVPHA